MPRQKHLPNITQTELRAVLRYDPGTGLFTRRIDRGRRWKAGEDAGSSMASGYIAVSVCGKSYGAHRLAWLYVHGVFPSQDIDHLDGNRANNRISNLRDVSPVVNGQNLHRCHQRSRSGVLGVCWFPITARWRAYIRAEGRTRTLGYFREKSDAVAARLAAELLYFPTKPRPQPQSEGGTR